MLDRMPESAREEGRPFFVDREATEQYWRRVDELAGFDPVPFAALVTGRFVFDFVVMYESLVECFAFYPFVLHAFVLEDEVEKALRGLELPHVEVHRLAANAGDWILNSTSRIDLIEHSGLERCVVTDVDVVWVAETPELGLLLDRYDLLFVGGPGRIWRAQAGLWAFRHNERTVAFGRYWNEVSRERQIGGHGKGSIRGDQAALPFALMKADELGVRVKVLGAGEASEGRGWLLAPYDVQANLTPFALERDELGFREPQMGRAKIIHFVALRGRGSHSLEARVDTMIDVYPGCVAALPYYTRLANRAARRLGMTSVDDPDAFFERRRIARGLLATADELPLSLRARGVRGTAVQLGVAERFAGSLLDAWDGERLIAVDHASASNEDAAPDPGSEERRSLWRMSFAEAAERLQPRSVDFVYVDEADGEAARALELWFDRVRPGGVIAGSAGSAGDGPQTTSAGAAVESFFDERGLRVKLTYGGEPACWHVELPRSRAEHLHEHISLLGHKIWSEMTRLENDNAQIRRWTRQRDELIAEREALKAAARRLAAKDST